MITHFTFIRSALGLGLALVTAAGLARCGGAVTALREQHITGSDFNAHLAREYQRLAVFEADQMYDRRDAGLFARKALAARDGAPLPPENPNARTLRPTQRPALVAAHRRLAVARALVADQRAPAALARAITQFECWMEQAEEGWQVDHIAACRDGFTNAMTAVEKTTGYRFQDDGAARGAFTLYHRFDRSDLTDDERRRLAAAIGSLRADLAAATGGSGGTADFDLVVTGHADRRGGAPYNHDLSRRRAVAVHRALVAAGLPPRHLGVSAAGETQPAITTADDVAAAPNRRTEVTWTLRPKAGDGPQHLAAARGD